jgi:hypothetical protein
MIFSRQQFDAFSAFSYFAVALFHRKSMAGLADAAYPQAAEGERRARRPARCLPA